MNRIDRKIAQKVLFRLYSAGFYNDSPLALQLKIEGILKEFRANTNPPALAAKIAGALGLGDMTHITAVLGALKEKAPRVKVNEEPDLEWAGEYQRMVSAVKASRGEGSR